MAADDDISCTRAGEAWAPCAYEFAFPPNYPSVQPHGLMLILVSGGFQSSPPQYASDYFRRAFNRWTNRGYFTAMVEHSDGSGVFPNSPTGHYAYVNVIQWYDHYRAILDSTPGLGPNFPMCVTGFSSGGHLALMLATARPALDCVVAEAPPSRIDYPAGSTRAPGLSADAQYIADLSFSGVGGVSPNPIWSPLYQQQSLGQIRMPVLIGHAENDPLVSPNQTHTFCPRTSSNCRSEYLSPGGGDVPDFTHADVKDRDLLDFRAKERSWVCAIVSPHTGPCS